MSGMTIELGKLGQMIALAAHKPDEAPTERGPMSVQVAKLRALRDAYDTAYPPFEGGQFVRLKEGLGNIKEESRPTMALMFWRHLDPADVADRVLIKKYTGKLGTSRIDCIVGYICDDGHCLIPHPMSTHDLEPWEPPADAPEA